MAAQGMHVFSKVRESFFEVIENAIPLTEVSLPDIPVSGIVQPVVLSPICPEYPEGSNDMEWRPVLGTGTMLFHSITHLRM
jgi:hypothetical protein